MTIPLSSYIYYVVSRDLDPLLLFRAPSILQSCLSLEQTIVYPDHLETEGAEHK